jgi:predicted RNA binding protein YcfA (HicA-like mRNA interferase family)
MKVRDLLAALREAGGQPVRTKGSHQTWRVGDKTVIVTVNHMNNDACRQSLASARAAGVKVR